MAKFLPRLSERTDKSRNLPRKNTEWKWETEQQNDFERTKKMSTEEPVGAHYSKDKYNIVTTDASKNGLGKILWQKQVDGEMKPIAFGSWFLNDSEKNDTIRELELLAVVWELEKFRSCLDGKKLFFYTDHQALEPLIKPNRCKK